MEGIDDELDLQKNISKYLLGTLSFTLYLSKTRITQA